MDLNEFHWLLAIVQSIDVGVVVLDRDYRVEVWNSFMENRSDIAANSAVQQSFFNLFKDVDEPWFRHKVDSVVTLGTPAFTVWEQRPYLVRFKNYQPITGCEDFMYQNTTLLPLHSTNGLVEHVCLIIYDVTNVAMHKKQLQNANTQLSALSQTDRLTGLHNRGHWEEQLQLSFARYQRYGTMAALVMFDIDYFKKVNDTYGHQAGDKVIRATAYELKRQCRDTDIAGRYGGEEFVVLMPDTNSAGAQLFAERLGKAIEQLVVEHEGVSIPFTISLGVADLVQPVASYAQLIERADHALYQSKSAGRNRSTVYTPKA